MTFHGPAGSQGLSRGRANERRDHDIRCFVDATIVVTMTLENLMGDSEAQAMLHTGDPISPSLARKLACPGRDHPNVLGGESEVLDVGRESRFHLKYQRIAMRSATNTAPRKGATGPAAMCHAHHNIPWSRGGKTNIADGRLLCPRHHSYAHSPKYEMKTIPNGRVVFSRT